MLRFILKRVLIFIPTIFAITLIGFFLLVNTSGNYFDQLTFSIHLKENSRSLENSSNNKFLRNELELDLPLFYFSILKLSEPDTLYKIYEEPKRNAYKALLYKTGNSSSIDNYYKCLSKAKASCEEGIKELKDDNPHTNNSIEFDQLRSVEHNLKSLELASNIPLMIFYLNNIKKQNYFFSEKNRKVIAGLERSISNLELTKTRYKNYLPKWFGMDVKTITINGFLAENILKGSFMAILAFL